MWTTKGGATKTTLVTELDLTGSGHRDFILQFKVVAAIVAGSTQNQNYNLDFGSQRGTKPYPAHTRQRHHPTSSRKQHLQTLPTPRPLHSPPVPPATASSLLPRGQPSPPLRRSFLARSGSRETTSATSCPSCKRASQEASSCPGFKRGCLRNPAEPLQAD